MKVEFKKRYGYDLPSDLDSIRSDARKWLDVINFRSDYFPDGWRQVYPILKELAPDPKMTLTHDSHNTFGAGTALIPSWPSTTYITGAGISPTCSFLTSTPT